LSERRKEEGSLGGCVLFTFERARHLFHTFSEVRMWVWACVCVCVSEREREEEGGGRGRGREREKEVGNTINLYYFFS